MKKKKFILNMYKPLKTLDYIVKLFDSLNCSWLTEYNVTIHVKYRTISVVVVNSSLKGGFLNVGEFVNQM